MGWHSYSLVIDLQGGGESPMTKRSVLKTLLAVVLTVLLLTNMISAAAATSTHKGKPPAPAKWTLMVYIVGDNNLDEYVPLDIETELAPAGSNADVSVVALADRAETATDWTGTLLFYVTQGMEATPENAIEDWGEANMGDPQTLIDFVRWTQRHYPADHYALSFWNHGWSWRPDHSMRDETDDDTLDQHEIEAVLKKVGPIDVIMYDACQMATIENEATVHSYSSAIVHSQEWVNWDGIEYELVIPELQDDPDMDAYDLAVVINQSSSMAKERTGSAVALDERWDNLIDAVDAWAVALIDGLPAHRHRYAGAFHGAQSFWGDPTARDLYDVAQRIQSWVPDPGIQSASQAVKDAVEDAVLDEWHIRPYADARGISIFLPLREQDLDDPATPEWNEFEYYRNYLAFARLTQWDEFLDAYINSP
jgi:hypothetical protein